MQSDNNQKMVIEYRKGKQKLGRREVPGESERVGE